jgi:flavin-dependent dehydrogenase
LDHLDRARWESQAVVDLGWIPNGYAWLFARAGHLSLGIAGLRIRGRVLKRAYWQFLNSLGLSRYSIERWSGGIIPMAVGNPTACQGRVALVGDAAGLADPLTGEGIYHAVLSGQLAARAIETSLAQNRGDLDAYQQSVEDQIMPEIRAARTFARIMGLMPRRLFNLIKLDGRVWQAGCSLVRGDTTYAAIKDRIGSLGGLYAILRRT